VRKGSFEKCKGTFLAHEEELGREEVISSLALDMGPDDFVVSTTGKISRELFEFCKNSKPANSSHNFLTVGSMGHASAIALSVALQHPEKRVWCLDGDGSALMHMGSMATIAVMKPDNYIHVVLNNEAHESVGGMPTIAGEVDLVSVALGCGYRFAKDIRTLDELHDLCVGDLEKPAFIQVFVGTGSREDLMRPDTTPQQNKVAFMEAVQA
jgi:phosphonopyruvate decarboxylase